MTPTILYADNPNHFFHLQQWDEAVDIHNALLDWREANVKPTDELCDYFGALQAEEQRLGLCITAGADDFYKGRIIANKRFGSNVLRLRKLTRDIDDKPTIGDRVVQCPQCNTLFSTFSQHDHFCTDACKAAAQADRTAAKADRRRLRQSERSEALASRHGICLACGNQFNLKRITGKTCSEACKKRLQRKPELAGEYLQPLLVSAELPALKQSERKHAQAALNLRIARMRGELSEQDQTILDKCEAYLDRVRPVIRDEECKVLLNAVAEHAPALAAWLQLQSAEIQQQAFSWKGAKTALGPDLTKKLHGLLE